MILYLDTNIDRRIIAISATQSPFDQIVRELRGLPRGVWAEQFICDREARYWMEIHGMQGYSGRIGIMRRSKYDSSVCAVFDGIPIEIDDELVVA